MNLINVINLINLKDSGIQEFWNPGPTVDRWAQEH